MGGMGGYRAASRGGTGSPSAVVVPSEERGGRGSAPGVKLETSFREGKARGKPMALVGRREALTYVVNVTLVRRAPNQGALGPGTVSDGLGPEGLNAELTMRRPDCGAAEYRSCF